MCVAVNNPCIYGHEVIHLSVCAAKLLSACGRVMTHARLIFISLVVASHHEVVLLN